MVVLSEFEFDLSESELKSESQAVRYLFLDCYGQLHLVII